MKNKLTFMSLIMLLAALVFTSCEIGNDDKKSSHFGLLALLGRGHWEQVGGSLENNPSVIEWPQITVKGTTPYVCWVEQTQLYVKHFDGSSWVQDGGSLNVNSGSSVAYPTIISDNTSVYVNWREATGGRFDLYVKKLTPAGWELVGNNYISSDANTDITRKTETSSIAISNNGTLYYTFIAVYGTSTSNQSWYFDGSTWLTLPSWLPWYYMSPFYPQLAFNNNILYIIWLDTLWVDSGESYIDVAYFDNNSQAWIRPWDPLNCNSIFTGRYPRMAASSDSTLYATWSEYNASQNNNSVYVKKLNGSAWTLVGGAGLNVDPASTADQQDITCVRTTPYVVWQEMDPDTHYSSIYVKHFKGQKWVQDGPALNVGATASNPRIASDGVTPYVVWKEQGQGSYSHVYVKRWVK